VIKVAKVKSGLEKKEVLENWREKKRTEDSAVRHHSANVQKTLPISLQARDPKGRGGMRERYNRIIQLGKKSTRAIRSGGNS